MDETRAMKRFYYAPGDPAFSRDIHLGGIGIGEPMPPGWVDRSEGADVFLLVCFHTACRVSLRGEPAEWLAPGTTVVWRPGRTHRFGDAQRPWDHSWLLFGGRDVERAAAALDEGAWERPLHVPFAGGLLPVLEGAYRELIVGGPPDLAALSLWVRLLLRLVARAASVARAVPEVDPLDAVRQHVDDHLAEPIDVARLARVASLSPSRFARVFRERYGLSPMRWVERQRLRRAAYWLEHSGLRVREVAARTGFGDPLHFSRRFRAAFGHAPRAHRIAKSARSA